MFDLDQQIKNWRRGMERGMGHEPARLDELEEHLRDHATDLIRRGSTGPEAFVAAVRRLGEASAIHDEFRKARAGMWWPARTALALAAVVAVAGAVVGGWALQRRGDLVLAAHVFTITTGYCFAFVIGGLGMFHAGYGLARGRSGVRQAGLGDAVSILSLAGVAFVGGGVGLGMIWSKQHLGRYWAWDPKETGGLIVFLWLALLHGAQRRTAVNERAVMMMGVVGSFLTSVAWFDSGLLAMGSHASEYSRGLVSPAGLVAFHAIFLLVGILPRRGPGVAIGAGTDFD